MTSPLSIIIASHNDPDETVKTLASIRSTSPPDVEVVIVDDSSATPLHHYIKPDEHTKLVENKYRCGCGPSRHIGALHATGEWLLIVDSHMRFAKGWYEAWWKIVAVVAAERTDVLGEPSAVAKHLKETIFCATCLGIDTDHMDPEHPVSEYHGATWNVYGTDRQDPRLMQVWELVWNPPVPELKDGDELAGIMGACYFISRDWFLYLSPTRSLRMWGGDEQQIAAKSWLAGGSVRLAKSVRIGHKFPIKGRERQPYTTPLGHAIYSKLFSINTLLPTDLAERLSKLLLSGKDTRDIEAARRMYREDFHLIATERAYNRTIFTRDFKWLCEKFGIPTP